LNRASPRVNPDAQLQKEFMDRVAKCVELRKAIEAKLPPLDSRANMVIDCMDRAAPCPTRTVRCAWR